MKKGEKPNLVLSGAIEKVLKELCEEYKTYDKSVEIVYKSGKDTIRQVFTGENRLINALKEVTKHI